MASIQQGYITSEPFAIQQQGGFEPVVFLLANYGYMPYAMTIDTRRELVENNSDLVQRFIDASIKSWYSYLKNPAPANELIKKDNREMKDDQIAYGIQKIKQYGLITSGDAAKLGIRIIAGLTQMSYGSIDWGVSDRTRKLAFVFQDPALMPWASVKDNITVPLKLARRQKKFPKQQCNKHSNE